MRPSVVEVRAVYARAFEVEEPTVSVTARAGAGRPVV